MSQNLKKCLEILKVISNIKSLKVRNQVLRDISGNDKIYNALREIALNAMNKNIKFNRNQKIKLKKQVGLLKRLSQKNNSKKVRQKLIVQTGGILPIIVPAAISLLSTILQHGIRR